MKEFENMHKGLDKKINWDTPILKHSPYIEKWRIWLWTKSIKPFF